MQSQYPYSPKRDHDILQVRWGNKIINALENIASLSKVTNAPVRRDDGHSLLTRSFLSLRSAPIQTGKAYKSNLVFVHRSPISSYHYARDRNPDGAALYLSLMRQITTVHTPPLQVGWPRI
jgi:hypothetical protein